MNMSKTTTISLRLSPAELEIIENKARQAGMNRNAFIVSSMVNGQKQIGPEFMCRLRYLQSMLNSDEGAITDEIRQSMNERINEICRTLLK